MQMHKLKKGVTRISAHHADFTRCKITRIQNFCHTLIATIASAIADDKPQAYFQQMWSIEHVTRQCPVLHTVQLLLASAFVCYIGSLSLRVQWTVPHTVQCKGPCPPRARCIMRHQYQFSPEPHASKTEMSITPAAHRRMNIFFN